MNSGMPKYRPCTQSHSASLLDHSCSALPALKTYKAVATDGPNVTGGNLAWGESLPVRARLLVSGDVKRKGLQGGPSPQGLGLRVTVRVPCKASEPVKGLGEECWAGTR